MSKLHKLCTGALLGLTLATSSGCFAILVGAAAGAGGYAYVSGVLESNFDNTVEEVHKATLAALDDQGVFVIKDELNKHSARIKAEYENGDDVTIDIKALTERVSKIRVRVGVFGNEERSFAILESVLDHI